MAGLLQPSPLNSPHVGKLKSFEEVEAKTREVLRQRGVSEVQIDAELKRAKRPSRWFWGPVFVLAMYPERRQFHQESDVTWALVFEPRLGLWYVEESGALGQRVRIALSEFQNIKRDPLLTARLVIAMGAAGVEG